MPTAPAALAVEIAARLVVPSPLTLSPAAKPGTGTTLRATYVAPASLELALVDAGVLATLAGPGDTHTQLAAAFDAACAATTGTGSLSAITEADTLAVEEYTWVALKSGRSTLGWLGVLAHESDPAAVIETAEPTGVAPGLRMLYGVELDLTVEIGRTRMPVRDVLALTPGAIVELDRAAGAPADLMANGRLVARGEVVVVDEEFGLRITEITANDASSLS